MLPVGALVMVGRTASEPSALYRYGGEKISASQWSYTHVPQRPPPAKSTRASGSTSAVEWYMRDVGAGASWVHFSVAGSHCSVAYTGDDSSL